MDANRFNNKKKRKNDSKGLKQQRKKNMRSFYEIKLDEQ